jgi:hypothetical protein
MIMQVYLVWEHYGDGGMGVYKTLVNIHESQDSADTEATRLECKFIDSGYSEDRSWYVECVQVLP